MPSQAHPGTQRGSIVISTAIFLGMAIVLLLGAELGYLYSVKREFQKTADLAAMAGAQETASDATSAGCAAAKTAAEGNAAANLGVGILAVADAAIVATPGRWSRVDGFTTASAGCNAVKVVISKTPDLLLPGIAGNTEREISATATAARATPRAALNIQSTLASVDTSQSALLNSVFGGLLGGSLNLSAVSWDGLVKSNVNLLSYLDALAVQLNVAAGQYDTVLNTDATVGQLLQAAVDALNKDGSVNGAVAVVQGVINASTNVSGVVLRLSQLLAVQTGTPASGLDLDLQAFQLVQGIVQLANSQSTVVASVPIAVPGIGTVSVKLKVIEPPQVSAIGNPELAKLNPDGPDRIYVQTAQVRTVISADLPLLSSITGLFNAVTNLLAPVTSLLNSVLTLNLQTLVGSILCLHCTQTQVVLVPDNPIHLTVNLNVASAEAKVTDVDCSSPASATLTVQSTTSAADIKVGQVDPAAEATLLTPGSTTVFPPIPLLDVETRTCTTILGITGCDSWAKYSRTGLKAETSALATTGSYTYLNPPGIDQPPSYHSLAGTNVIDSLSGTLSGVQLQTYKYSSTAPNHFGDLIGTATQLVQAAVAAVQGVITSLLSSLLDSLVNLLLNQLGIQVAKADVGARLSCSRGVELVY